MFQNCVIRHRRIATEFWSTCIVQLIRVEQLRRRLRLKRNFET